MASPLDIIRNALIDLNKLGIAETAPTGEDVALGLSHYNRLVTRWAGRSKMSYYERNQAFPFAVSKQSYTIGPTGSAADFIFSGGVRPPVISRAKLVMTTSTPATELDLPVIYKDRYDGLVNPAQTGTQPYCVYYQPTFPIGTLWPVPYPLNTANQLRLFWWAQLEVVAIADVATDIPMPPALEDALTWTLEERLCVPFEKQIPPALTEQARGARQAYSQLNDADPAFIATALRGSSGAVDTYWFQSRGH